MRTALQRFREMQTQDDSTQRPSAGSLSKTTIREFATSGRTVRIRSEVLGCDVILAADNADVSRAVASAGIAVFRAREFEHLRDVTPEQVRLIHATKLEFGGELVD